MMHVNRVGIVFFIGLAFQRESGREGGSDGREGGMGGRDGEGSREGGVREVGRGEGGEGSRERSRE